MIRRPLLIVSMVLLAMAALPASAQETGLPGDCALDDAADVRVLLLIDQSGSLQRTDPDDQRVAGAKAVVSSYASLAERVGGVELQVAGFGETFQPGEWTALDASTLGAALERVEAVAGVTDQDHTDYVYALDGAVDAFSGGSADCQILFWFTDGEHDLDERLLPPGGLERFYFDQPVTPANVAEAESVMPGLICEAGGYADQLGDAGVSPQIMLLGDESGVDANSRRVLRGMGGDPAFGCGPGNGSFQAASDATRLPFLMACASQVGGYPLGLSPEAGSLSVDDQVIDGGQVPYPLVTRFRLIARGTDGQPHLDTTTLTEIEESGDTASRTTVLVGATDGAPFTLRMEGVAEACGFVDAEAAQPLVQSVTPTLYQGEPGRFRVVADGPHGRLEAAVLDRLQVESDAGTVGAPDGEGWVIDVPGLPEQPDYQLPVTIVSAPGLTAATTTSFTLNEQINAPVIVSQPSPVSGEGVGPFPVQLEIDPRDGGELCLLDTTATIDDAQGQVITAAADLEGSECVVVEPGEIRAVTLALTLDRSGFAHQVVELRTRSTPSTGEGRTEDGVLAVDLEVTPKANPTLVALIVAALMLLMLAVLWGIVYGVNRFIGRIPDPRRNRIRYADFVAELTPSDYGELATTLVEAPTDSQFRIPRRTPGRLDAGRLRIERVVSPLPWVAPYASIGIGSDLVASHQGPGLPGRTLTAEKWFRGRPRDALGPLVAVGLTAAQLDHLAEGTSQKVPGVLLFDVREARGSDASRFAAGLIDGSLDLIAAEISTQRLVETMERTGET